MIRLAKLYVAFFGLIVMHSQLSAADPTTLYESVPVTIKVDGKDETFKYRLLKPAKVEAGKSIHWCSSCMGRANAETTTSLSSNISNMDGRRQKPREIPLLRHRSTMPHRQEVGRGRLVGRYQHADDSGTGRADEVCAGGS